MQPRLLTGVLMCSAFAASAACSKSSNGNGPDAPMNVDTPVQPTVDAMDDSLVYAHSGNHLYRIDTRTNASVDIGPLTGIGTQSITDIAVDKDGKMVGITLDKLYAIDPGTGAATLVKDLSAAAKSENFTSLSYVPTDFANPDSAEILVAASTAGSVFQIDPVTGDATKIGAYGGSGVTQIGSSGDIVAVRGLGILATVNIGQTLTAPDYLATIDPVTWAATPLAQTTGFDRIFGLAYWKGTVYGFVDDANAPSTTGSLISIDAATGAATKLMDSSVGWFGAGVTTNAPLIPVIARAALLGLLLGAASARAEDAAVDATLVAPFGDWATQTGVGAGATARVRVPTGAFIAITARAGLYWHAAADDGALTVRLIELPLLGGVRYYVTAPARLRAYLAGEAGVVLERASIAQGGSVDDEWRFVFGSSLGAGVELDRFELGASIWLPDLAHVEHSAAAMITVGASFASW